MGLTGGSDLKFLAFKPVELDVAINLPEEPMLNNLFAGLGIVELWLYYIFYVDSSKPKADFLFIKPKLAIVC